MNYRLYYTCLSKLICELLSAYSLINRNNFLIDKSHRIMVCVEFCDGH